MSGRLLMAAALCLLPAAAAMGETVHYAKPSHVVRADFLHGLLDLALARSGRLYVLRPVEQAMTQARALRELEGGRIDVVWAGTSIELEERFRPIRIPVLRGLIGYRVCIIDRRRQDAFSAIGSLAEFRRMTIGQGTGWSDVTVLQAAGFAVATSSYDTLFAMTERGRIDCFLRGITEAADEVAQRIAEHPHLAVETDLLLVYPFASFLFVARGNAALAASLETGLRKAYDDGAFMAYFEAHPLIKAVYVEARFDRRRRYEIPNPLMTEESLTIPGRYWHSWP